jgi:hypothetical protein
LLRIGGLSREQDRGNKNFIACHDTLALSQESSPAVAAENQRRWQSISHFHWRFSFTDRNELSARFPDFAP